MKPRCDDAKHNRRVGTQVLLLIGELAVKGYNQDAVSEGVGLCVNSVAKAAYDCGQQELQPSQN